VVDKFLLTFSGGANAELFDQLTKPDICNSIVSINNTRRKWFDDPLAAAPPDATPPSLAPKPSLATQINNAVFRRVETRIGGDFSGRGGGGGVGGSRGIGIGSSSSSSMNMTGGRPAAPRPVSYARRGSGDRAQISRQTTCLPGILGAPRSPPLGLYTPEPDPNSSGNSRGSANSNNSMFGFTPAGGGGHVSDSDKARFAAYRLSSVDECDDVSSQYAESTKQELRPVDVDLSAQGRRRNVVPPRPGGPALWTAGRDVPYPAGTQMPTQPGRESLPLNYNAATAYSIDTHAVPTTSRITLTERRASYGDDPTGIESDYAAAEAAAAAAPTTANPQHGSSPTRKKTVPVLNLGNLGNIV
jgi:hypothetical protein